MKRFKKMAEMSAVEVENMTEAELKAMKRREASRKSIEKRKSLPKYSIPTGGLQTVPADYSTAKFQPLEQEDFASAADYMDYKVLRLEKQVVRLREEANTLRSLGSVKDPKKAKKISKLFAEFAEMKASSEDGVDIKAMMKDWLEKNS